MHTWTDPENLLQVTRASVYTGNSFRTAAETALPTATVEDSTLAAIDTPGAPGDRNTVPTEYITPPSRETTSPTSVP